MLWYREVTIGSAWVTGQVWGSDGGLGSVKLRPVTKLGAATRKPKQAQ